MRKMTETASTSKIDTRYRKLKKEIMDRADRALARQKRATFVISKRVKFIAREGEKAVSEFVKNSIELRPLSHQLATEAFLPPIHEFINAKTETKQQIAMIIEQTKVQQRKATAEADELRRLYKVVKGNCEKFYGNTELQQNTRVQLKAIITSEERILEVKDNVGTLERTFEELLKTMEDASSKLINYRLMLTVVVQTRNIGVASKNLYMECFNKRDFILKGLKEIKSRVKTAKFLLGEAAKCDFYKVDENMETLLKKLEGLKKSQLAVNKRTPRHMTKLTDLQKKAEENERAIVNFCMTNINSPSTGYSKSQSHYEVILRLNQTMDASEKKIEQYETVTATNLTRANEILADMDRMLKNESITSQNGAEQPVPTLVNLDRVDSRESTGDREKAGDRSDSHLDNEIAEDLDPKNEKEIRQT